LEEEEGFLVLLLDPIASLQDDETIFVEDEEDETCPICGWHGASIPVMVLKKKWTETLVYIEEE
jgi:hypothetical protein